MTTNLSNHMTENEREKVVREIAEWYVGRWPRVTLGWLTLKDAIKVIEVGHGMVRAGERKLGDGLGRLEREKEGKVGGKLPEGHQSKTGQAGQDMADMARDLAEQVTERLTD